RGWAAPGNPSRGTGETCRWRRSCPGAVPADRRRRDTRGARCARQEGRGAPSRLPVLLWPWASAIPVAGEGRQFTCRRSLMDNHPPRRRLLATLCVLLAANLAVMSWLAWQTWQSHRDRFLEQAETHLAAGRTEAALRALSLHLEHYPGDEEVEKRRAALETRYHQSLLGEARRRLAAEDRAGAVAAFKDYLERVPDDVKVQLELAKLYEGLGAEDEAELAYRRVAEAGPAGAGAASVDEARNRLFRLVNERANGLKRRADTLANQ